MRFPPVLSRLADDRLVEQVRRGNDVAFQVLYDRHQAPLLSFCRHMLGSREEAEDALQHTFLSAHREIAASEKQLDFRPWAFAVARNRCLSTLRARREHASESPEPPTEGLAEVVERRADLRGLLTDLPLLPDDQRAALLLSELRGFSHAEIGRVLDCDAAKVKSLVFQARTSLIEGRAARELSCAEVGEALANPTGVALGRRTLRRHLRSCAECVRYRDEVRAQRQALGALLPVVPTLGLREQVLATIGLGGGGGAGGAGGIAAGAALVAPGGATKLAAGALCTAAAVGAVALPGGGAGHGSGGSPPNEPTDPHDDVARPAQVGFGAARAGPSDGRTGGPASRRGATPAGAMAGRARERVDDGSKRLEVVAGHAGPVVGAAPPGHEPPEQRPPARESPGQESSRGRPGQGRGEGAESVRPTPGPPPQARRNRARPDADPRFGLPVRGSRHGQGLPGPVGRRPGFSPQPGGPNGDQAREFARDRARGSGGVPPRPGHPPPAR